MVSKENKHYEDAIHCEDVCIFRFESGFLKQRIHDLEDASLPSQDFLVFNNIDSFFFTLIILPVFFVDNLCNNIHNIGSYLFKVVLTSKTIDAKYKKITLKITIFKFLKKLNTPFFNIKFLVLFS